MPRDTPRWVGVLLDAPVTLVLMRLALTLPYWWSAIAKILHPGAALAEVAALGMPAPELVLAATLAVQAGGSVLIVWNRHAWLGAGALAVFTGFATLIGHPFWRLEGAARFEQMNSFLEHIALIAGFGLVAALAWRRRPDPSPAR